MKKFSYSLVLDAPDLSGIIDADTYSEAYKKLVKTTDDLKNKYGLLVVVEALYQIIDPGVINENETK